MCNDNVCLSVCVQYTGKGIDLRRRKIWGYYGDRADLEVCSLTPSDLTVFPQFDWLIGNHSDELTPWIPLMAARLPCTSPLFRSTSLLFHYNCNTFLTSNAILQCTSLPTFHCRSSYQTRYFVLPCCPHDFDSKVGCVLGNTPMYCI